MCDIGAKIPANHTVPRWVVLLVELFLDVGGDVFLDVELLQSHIRTVDCILLHLLVHVCMFYYGLSLCCRHLSNQFIFISIQFIYFLYNLLSHVIIETKKQTNYHFSLYRPYITQFKPQEKLLKSFLSKLYPPFQLSYTVQKLFPLQHQFLINIFLYSISSFQLNQFIYWTLRTCQARIVVYQTNFSVFLQSLHFPWPQLPPLSTSPFQDLRIQIFQIFLSRYFLTEIKNRLSLQSWYLACSFSLNILALILINCNFEAFLIFSSVNHVKLRDQQRQIGQIFLRVSRDSEGG